MKIRQKMFDNIETCWKIKKVSDNLISTELGPA